MKLCGRVVLWALMTTCGCAIDDRELTLGVSGGRGGSGEPGAGSGGREPSGAGGEAGSANRPPDELVDGCADLDTDGVGDCTTTLVETPTFTDDVSGWVPVDDATLTWDERNALADLPSGSAKLSASSTRASAVQCLELTGRWLVIAYAQVLAEPAAPAEMSRAQLQVSFFASRECEGEPIGFFETPTSVEQDDWVTVQAGGVSDEKSRSMSIALSGVKPAEAKELVVYFDNIMLKTKELD
jgi:hypothetical protein